VIAEETGAATAVLDPLETLTDDSAGTDYLSVMRANLVTLRRGQGC
jgi:zinc transport system substrate-binding protein